MSKIKRHKRLDNPSLHIVLYEPEIPSNTGNIARLCGAAELRLHLIHPLGFKTDDKHLKRAGLDYWSEVDIHHHEDFECFKEKMDDKGTLITFSRHAEKSYPEAKVKHGDYLLFGKETAGLPMELLNSHHAYAIPIWGNVRCLNLSTSVGIVTYHYLHKLGRF